MAGPVDPIRSANIAAGQQATITASLQNDSNGGTPAGPFFHPVLTTFTANPGIVTPNQVVTDALLHATTAWPAGQPRPESICASVDHQTVCLHFEATRGSIIPKVVSKETGTPVKGTKLKVLDASGKIAGTCTTDANGTCDVIDLQTGTYHVCVVRVPKGYLQPKQLCTGPVTVTEGVETPVTITLQKSDTTTITSTTRTSTSR